MFLRLTNSNRWAILYCPSVEVPPIRAEIRIVSLVPTNGGLALPQIGPRGIAGLPGKEAKLEF